MTRYFRRRLAIFIITALCITSVWPYGLMNSIAKASGTVVSEKSIDPGARLGSIKLDESRGYLYASSYETNELLFINKDTLDVEKRLAVGNQPQGMDLVGDKLYVALSGATFIAVVNLETRTVETMVPTTVKPAQVAVDGNSLYYADGDQWCTIYRKDLSTGEEKIIEASIYSPLLLADRETHRLYATEVGITRAQLTVFNSTYGDKQNQFEHDGSYDTSLVVNSGEIYFGTLRINPDNMVTVSTTPGRILAVDDAFIYSESGIFTKDEGINVVKFPDTYMTASFMEVDHNRTLYIYNSWTSRLSKTIFNFPIAPAAIQYTESVNQITFNRNLDAWAVGKDEKYMYAVSTESNRLLQIDSLSFKVIADRYIGSKPSDVDIHDGIIYVSLSGSTHLVKIDTTGETNFMAPLVELEIGETTIDIAAGVGKAYYATGNYWTTVGVFDSVYSSLTNNTYSRPSLTMNEDKSLLYIGETNSSGSNLYKLDTTTNTYLQYTNGGNGYGSKEVISDGEYVYYAGQRFAANDLSKIYGVYKDGYYSAKLLFAKGKQVLGSTALYDRDTFNPVYKLPFTVSYGYIKRDGSIILFSGNGSQYGLFKYDNLENMESDLQNKLRPVAAYFIDEDWDPLSVDGKLTIYPGPAALNATNYRIDYYDADDNLLDYLGFDYVYSWEKQPDGTFVHNLSKNLPANAKKIGITPYIQQPSGGNTIAEEARLLIRIWDYDTYYVEKLSFNDTDSSLNAVGGAVSFKQAPGEIPGDRYAVYFAGEDGYIGDPIGYVSGIGALNYQFTIAPGTVIPEGAIAVAVNLQDKDGSEAPGYNLCEIYDRMSKALDAGQISVINNSGANDTVSVTGLSAGDIIHLYSYNGPSYGDKKVAAGSTSVFYSGLKLNDEIPLLLASITTPGKHESFYTIIDYSSNGNAGGGSSGGGSTGGGGGSSGGGGGGGLSNVVTVAGNSSAKLAVTEVSKNTDGTTTAAVKLDDKLLETELAKWSGSANKIIISISEAADTAKITVSGGQLGKIINKDKNAILQIQTADSGFIIPVAGLGYSDAEQESYILNIAALRGSSAEAAQKLLGAQAIEQVGTAYEFTITKQTSGGTAVELKNLDRYIGHIITLTKLSQPMNSLSAVMIDTASGAVTPVPAVFAQDGDKIMATIYRKGNSVYSVVSGAGEFKDVPVANFAKTAIEKLAVRKVVNGYSDGSFKPEAAVTRAEAATLLVKTLGIVPANGNAVFKDVKPGAWYADSVASAVQAGLFKGYTDGTFKPDQTITQQEMVAIIYQALLYGNYEPDSTNPQGTLGFDATAGYKTWSTEAVNVLIKEGIIKNKDAFPIKAEKQTTRAESAELIYRLLTALKLI